MVSLNIEIKDRIKRRKFNRIRFIKFLFESLLCLRHIIFGFYPEPNKRIQLILGDMRRLIKMEFLSNHLNKFFNKFNKNSVLTNNSLTLIKALIY